MFFEDWQLEIFAKGFDAGIRLSEILAKDVIAIKLFGPLNSSPPHLTPQLTQRELFTQRKMPSKTKLSQANLKLF